MTDPVPSKERIAELIAEQERQSSFLASANHPDFDPMLARAADTIAALKRLERLETALRGISTCSTCERCRGAAALALGGATPEPKSEQPPATHGRQRLGEIPAATSTVGERREAGEAAGGCSASPPGDGQCG